MALKLFAFNLLACLKNDIVAEFGNLTVASVFKEVIEFPARRVVKAEADRIVVTFYGNYKEKHKFPRGNPCKYIVVVYRELSKEADVLYINFKKSSHADDSELTDDDLIIRYEKGEIVGVTILNASRRRVGYGHGV